jgi:hypothetical protein
MILGNNPACTLGAPVGLDWEYRQLDSVKLDEYEKSRVGKRYANRHQFYLSYYKRQDIIESAGYTKEEFYNAERQVQWIQLQRQLSFWSSFPYIFVASRKASAGRRKTKRFLHKYRKEQDKLLKKQHRQQKQ